jgi:NADH-quinone oxidoreductase subunit L
MYLLAPGLPGAVLARFRGIHRFLVHKWYFDEFYDAVFVRPAFYLGRQFWKVGDGTLIDGLGPDGLAAATVDIARRGGRLQSGLVYHYAFAMLIGVVLLISWYFLVQAG